MARVTAEVCARFGAGEDSSSRSSSSECADGTMTELWMWADLQKFEMLAALTSRRSGDELLRIDVRGGAAAATAGSATVVHSPAWSELTCNQLLPLVPNTEL